MAGKCTICGETDPMPASMCLAKLVGEAQPGRPCQYSAEGCERLRVAMQERHDRSMAELDEAKTHGARFQADQGGHP